MPTFQGQTQEKVKPVTNLSRSGQRSRKKGQGEQSVVVYNGGKPLRKVGSFLRWLKIKQGSTRKRLLGLVLQ